MDSKKAVFAGIGWLERAQEKIEDLVEELVERGELTRKDSSGFLRQVMEQAKGEREEFHKIVEEILRDAAGSAGIATRDELEDLKGRLAALEKSISKMRDEADAPKPAAKKKPVVKKKSAAKPKAVKKPPAKKTAAKKPVKKK